MLQIHKITIRNGEEVEKLAKGEDELFIKIAHRYRNIISPGTGDMNSQLTIYYVRMRVMEDIVQFKSVADGLTVINDAVLHRN